jgi:hypothetical protein
MLSVYIFIITSLLATGSSHNHTANNNNVLKVLGGCVMLSEDFITNSRLMSWTTPGSI